MQIVYCETCGKRITDAAQAHQEGDRWICLTCRPATSSAAPVEDDPERGRSTVMVERLSGAAPSSQARRRGSHAQGSRGGVGAQPPAKSPLPLYFAAGAVVLVAGVAGLLLMPGKSAPTVTATSGNGSSNGGSSAASSGGNAAPAPPPAVPAAPAPVPVPVPATPNPAPGPQPAPADPTRPPAVKESDARAKFAPLKAEFDRARAANDLKTMARVTGEMGMVTRDFDGTATAAEALATIKLFGEIRAADRMREAGAEFRKAKAAAKEYNEEVAEAIANLRKLAKEAAGTTAAAEAETDIKHYLEGEAARLWGRAKGKTAGDAPEAVAACDVAARVAREFAGTDAAKEAEKALADEEKRLVEARGTSAFLVLQSALWRARDPKSMRELAGQAHVLIDAGEDAEALGGLANRALRALDQIPTPAGRPRVALNWPNANAVKRDFSGVGGAREEVVKEGDKGAVKFASPGAAVRVMAMLMQPEEDTVLKLTYKVQGIKSLTLRFASATHRAAFEYTVPNLKNDAAETLVLPLASVKKDAHSLRNAFVTLFEIRAEKAKPDGAAAALFLYSGDVNSGRAK